MASIPDTHPIPELARYIQACHRRYAACLDHVEHSLQIDGMEVVLRFHHIKFDANGEPKFSDLAACLADHLIEYTFSARRRGTPEHPHQYAKLLREAKRLLREDLTSGEAGEILLYFLLETVIGAPQVVAKLDLKTNRKMEIHGSDGIHMRWNEADSLVDLYFGEAKLEQTVYSALDNAFASIRKFHDDGMQEHEGGLVTSHFKHLDERVREAAVQWVDRQEPGGDCRINHACLIGYNWSAYTSVRSAAVNEVVRAFRDAYASDASSAPTREH